MPRPYAAPYLMAREMHTRKRWCVTGGASPSAPVQPPDLLWIIDTDERSAAAHGSPPLSPLLRRHHLLRPPALTPAHTKTT